jgi:hypothetical protein
MIKENKCLVTIQVRERLSDVKELWLGKGNDTSNNTYTFRAVKKLQLKMLLSIPLVAPWIDGNVIYSVLIVAAS